IEHQTSPLDFEKGKVCKMAGFEQIPRRSSSSSSSGRLLITNSTPPRISRSSLRARFWLPILPRVLLGGVFANSHKPVITLLTLKVMFSPSGISKLVLPIRPFRSHSFATSITFAPLFYLGRTSQCSHLRQVLPEIVEET